MGLIVVVMDITELAMMLEATDTGEVTSDEFEFACETAKRLQLDDEQRLQLYGLYKQATVGDINTSKPMALDMVGSAKWNSWKSFEGFPKKAAAQAYVYLVEGESASASQGDSERDKAVARGEEDVFTSLGAMMGINHVKYGGNTSGDEWTSDQKIFHAVTDGTLEQLEALLKDTVDVNSRDQEGMTPLHYAVDRCLVEAVSLLIEHKADLDAQNKEGETPLMMAVTCEHENMVKLLIESGAKKEIKNNDGSSAADMCENDELRSILQ